MGQGGPGHSFSRGSRPTEPIAHGGDLDAARRLFPDAPEPWLDLSTGINPVPYPAPPLDASAFRRLPSAADVDALREVAAAAYGVRDPAGVVPAPGTQILIETLPRLWPRSHVAVVGPTYAEHAAAWARAGHAVATVPDLAGTQGAEVVVIVNPNNPDGRARTDVALMQAADRLPAGGLLVVDEAFADFEPAESLGPQIRPGIVVLRSFGKTYGLAGIRLGFALADTETAGQIAAALGPWAVSGPALAIGRVALADLGWRAEAAVARRRDAERLDRLLVRAGGHVAGGTALFRTADFPDGPGLFRRLGEGGVYVRRFEATPSRLRFGLPGDRTEWCRVSGILK